MSQYMPQMPPQIPMQGYGYPGQPMPMQQPMNQDTRDYINRMRQQIDAFEQRFSQPPPMPQPVQQQPIMQQQPNQMQQQKDNRIVLIPVSSYEEVEQYDVDLTGKTQWFVIEESKEVFTKKFDIKAKRPGMIFESAKLAPVPDANSAEPAETPPEATESKPDPEPKPDNIKALEDEIAALKAKQEEMEEKLNARPTNGNDGRQPEHVADDPKPNASPPKSNATPAESNGAVVPADSADVERGTKAKPNNRKTDPAKAGSNADPVRPDSK